MNNESDHINAYVFGNLKEEESMAKISKDMTIGDILRVDEGLVPILLETGMHCLGCPASQMESLEDACAVHGTDVDAIIAKMNDFLAAKAV